MKQNRFFTILILICFFAIYLYTENNAQDVGLTTQAQVNAFSGTVINGTLAISGADITDLTPLSTLTSVTGDVYIIDNLVLTNLNGLNNLISIGGFLQLLRNSILTNVDGMNSLNVIGLQLDILFNPNLLNINGFSNLVSIGDDLDIHFNDALTNLDGLRKLTSIERIIFISNNHSLKNLDGLSSLISVGDNLFIQQNHALNNFCGLYPLLNSGGLVGTFTVNGNFTPITIQADILNNCVSFSVDSKIYLEGPYNLISNNINTTLSSIPLSSPFAADPKTVGSIPVNAVDWVLIELRDKLNPSTIVASRSSFVLTDGSIVDMDGFSPVLFPEIAIEYFLSVKQRNHLEVMSGETIK